MASMPCHERYPGPDGRPGQAVTWILAALAGLVLAGCGGRIGNFDTPEPASSKLANLLGFSNKGAAAPLAPGRHIFCPEVIVLEGTAASQVYAGTPSNANLRYQSTLSDTARECALEGDQLAVKIGVAGKVLLGPAGAPGSFGVPVRMAVLRKHDNQPLVTKLYRAAVTVPPGETQADFTIVSELFRVPFIQNHTEDDYTIKVGIDEGSSAEKPAGKASKR
jgi:hypothetical protein